MKPLQEFYDRSHYVQIRKNTYEKICQFKASVTSIDKNNKYTDFPLGGNFISLLQNEPDSVNQYIINKLMFCRSASLWHFEFFNKAKRLENKDMFFVVDWLLEIYLLSEDF